MNLGKTSGWRARSKNLKNWKRALCRANCRRGQGNSRQNALRVRCARLSNQRQRANRRSRPAADLERRGGEDEFVDAVGGELLEIQAFDDVDAVFDQQVDVHGHSGGGNELEGDGVGAGGESAFTAD